MLKLITDKHEESCGLSATAELLVSLSLPVNPKHNPCTCQMMLRCFSLESKFWLWIHEP